MPGINQTVTQEESCIGRKFTRVDVAYYAKHGFAPYLVDPTNGLSKEGVWRKVHGNTLWMFRYIVVDDTGHKAVSHYIESGDASIMVAELRSSHGLLFRAAQDRLETEDEFFRRVARYACLDIEPATVQKVADSGGDPTEIRPDYYGGPADPFEPWKVLRVWGLNHWLCAAIEYIYRAGKKPGVDPVEDLRKAVTYVKSEIRHIEEKRDQA